MEDPGTCYGPGSVAGAVIGTFLATCLLLVIAALLYRQWRRNKGKHLVLVTDPEIVEEAYAFDNPCFKDATPAVGRSLERHTQTAVLSTHSETSKSPIGKEHVNRWSTPWANLGMGKNEKRRTLDDSCLGPKATRVSVVGLRSRDFTGLGFNVCGNMREGIFVKDLLHRGPASESGRIHPGDRINNIKISFRSMVYEDALTILSYASPYDVELEVESGGGTGSKPTTLLKKSIGPSPTHICHPLYRSQSIPELSQPYRPKHLFTDPNDSSYSTLNSTIKSSKSTPGTQTLERHHDELNKADHHHHHPKFGIKVLPALDGTVHRVENQNEHNTNLERRNSRKIEPVEKRNSNNSAHVNIDDGRKEINNKVNENLQQRSAVATPSGKKVIHVPDSVGFDVPDRAAEVKKVEEKPAMMASDVPSEVHNAGMAARRNRKSSNMELEVQKMQQQLTETQQSSQQETAIDINEAKSPQKGKRKAPAPPSRNSSTEINTDEIKTQQDEKTIDSINEYDRTINLTNEKPKAEEEATKQSSDSMKDESKQYQGRSKRISTNNRRNSESDTDSEIQNSFTTIELKPSDITVHHTPVPEAVANDDEEDEHDVYRKAASLGDLSKYESKAAATLERAQSLDMTDTGSKKRKAPMPPPEDIHESTEDLTKLDQIDTLGRKLKKSSEWGTLEDAIWNAPGTDTSDDKMPIARKKSNGSGGGTLERSKSNVEIKVTKDEDEKELSPEPLNVSDGAIETSLELYNLPLSKKLTQDFIRAERLFDPEEDNALARLVNDGTVVKSLSPEQIDLEFSKAHPLSEDSDDTELNEKVEIKEESPEVVDNFEKAIRYFDAHTMSTPLSTSTKVHLTEAPEDLYAGKKEIIEEPISKVTVKGYQPCPGCAHRHDKHSDNCTKKVDDSEVSYHQTIRVEDAEDDLKTSDQQSHDSEKIPLDKFETHFAKPIMNIPKSDAEDDEDEAAYEFGSAVDRKNLPSASPDKHNVSNVSVSSGESSEDSGLVRESTDFGTSETSTKSVPPLPNTPMPSNVENAPQKMTYITEIKVLPTNRENNDQDDDDNADNEEVVSILEGSKKSTEASSSASSVTLNVTTNGKLPAGKKPPVPPRRSDATRFVQKNNVTTPEKQIVYVSEYKSPLKEDKNNESNSGKKYENYIYLKDAGKEKQQEINPWGNGSSPSQPVTNIVLSSSGEDKIVRK